jgi:uncharacterized membrane protein YeaQ/YmgE (transglycosylase-associated protein family)
MHIIYLLIIGLVIGAIAKFLMPGRDPGGCIVTMIIGVVGSMLGGLIGQWIGLYQPGEPAGFIMSIVGALILLFLYRLIIGKRNPEVQRISYCESMPLRTNGAAFAFADPKCNGSHRALCGLMRSS